MHINLNNAYVYTATFRMYARKRGGGMKVGEIRVFTLKGGRLSPNFQENCGKVISALKWWVYKTHEPYLHYPLVIIILGWQYGKLSDSSISGYFRSKFVTCHSPGVGHTCCISFKFKYFIHPNNMLISSKELASRKLHAFPEFDHHTAHTPTKRK